MKWLTYIKYFLYIAWNWNFQLAFFSIYHEIRGEKKYGINTTGLAGLNGLTIISDNKRFGEIYQGAGYYLLETVLKELRERNVPDGFLDAGCGKGRAMVVAAHFGFTSITGIDFAEELCKAAAENCRRITMNFPATVWRVVHADAARFTIQKDIHVIFLFNPFKEDVMKKVIKNIRASLKDHPRDFFVAYINPQQKELFLNQGFEEVFYMKKMSYVEACILKNR